MTFSKVTLMVTVSIIVVSKENFDTFLQQLILDTNNQLRSMLKSKLAEILQC